MNIKKPSTAAAVHRLHPGTKTFWNVAELVREAGLRGLPTTTPSVADAIAAGRGPRIYGTLGRALVIKPEDGERWITAELERRGRMRPTKWQREHGVDEESFASIA